MADSVTGTMMDLATRAAVMRQAFDQSFAVPHLAAPAAHEDLLAIRIGSNAYAIRLTEIAGLFVDRVITPLPQAVGGLLGIAGFRGHVIPVYALRWLIGVTPGASATTATPSRWLVLALRAPVALAFDGFDGHLRLPARAIVPNEERAHGMRFVRDVLWSAGVTRPILHVPSILDVIVDHARSGLPQQERGR